jgi:hypothetical protein
MDNFLGELVERLAAARGRSTEIKNEYEAERASLEARYRAKQSEADEEYRALETLIRLEEQKTGTRTVVQPRQFRLPLQDFFILALDKHGPLSKDDLRDQAARASYFAEGDSAGRVTHATVINLVRSGRIKEATGGRYCALDFQGLGQPESNEHVASINKIEEDEWGEPLDKERAPAE